MSETDAVPQATKLRLAAVEMPSRIAMLPRDARGYAIPKFVHWSNGKPDFRVMDPLHFERCLKHKHCWVCGHPLGRQMTFVVGPMCIVNRTSSEPPSHLSCGEYSAKVCPFLAIPVMRRLDDSDLPKEHGTAGISLARNPGVVCLWTTRHYRATWVKGNPAIGSRDGVLISMGAPDHVEWYREGREATKTEVEESITSGMPFLERMAVAEGGAAVKELMQLHARALTYLPRNQ
jgi:hypothetical protein